MSKSPKFCNVSRVSHLDVCVFSSSSGKFEEYFQKSMSESRTRLQKATRILLIKFALKVDSWWAEAELLFAGSHRTVARLRGGGSQKLTHNPVPEHRELVFIEFSLANGQELPAQNLGQLLPGEGGRVQEQQQVLRNKMRELISFCGEDLKLDVTFFANRIQGMKYGCVLKVQCVSCKFYIK